MITAVAPLLFTNPLASQIAGSGSIQGVVTDSSGAIVTGAAIVTANTATEAASFNGDSGISVIRSESVDYRATNRLAEAR
jgi:cytoskeletal protein CcmA (bactofilin family)